MKAPRFRLRWLMGVVAACAVACAFLRAPGAGLFLVLGVPFVGALVHRSLGGRGILGGMIGGALLGCGVVCAHYVREYLYVRPDPVHPAGLLLSLVVASFLFGAIGAGVGFFVAFVHWLDKNNPPV
ncbi:MAG TPA: hypothetical protein VG406_29215 [Isosphaeraceae bacterium]|jgi:hypothetical protein|nr:hypothetical protein [Isosphaeraceae bacterium]